MDDMFGVNDPQPKTIVNGIHMKAPPRNKIDGLPEATMKIGQGGVTESVFYGKLLKDQMDKSSSTSADVQTVKKMSVGEITNCLKSDLKEFDKHTLLVKIMGRTTRNIPWGDISRDLGISEVSCRRSWANIMVLRRNEKLLPEMVSKAVQQLQSASEEAFQSWYKKWHDELMEHTDEALSKQVLKAINVAITEV